MPVLQYSAARALVHSLFFIFHAIILGFLCFSWIEGGNYFETIGMINNFAALNTTVAFLAHKAYHFGDEDIETTGPVLARRRNIMTSISHLIWSLAGAIVFSVRVSHGKICGDFKATTAPCAIANIVVIFSWITLLLALVGLALSFFEGPIISRRVLVKPTTQTGPSLGDRRELVRTHSMEMGHIEVRYDPERPPKWDAASARSLKVWTTIPLN
ncbi:hypothetical protein C8J56DRAFT_1168566 [Mycena floridula]|nr:hypothetical protein C8J56DRAFT_1168566 [Mycena floridula]